MKHLSIIAALVAVLIASSFAHAAAQTSQTAPETPLMRVSGSATASTVPDLVQLYVAVETRGPSAQGAAGDNATTVTAVLAAMRAKLPAGSQVTTANYSLSPNYTYPQQGGEPKLVGYIALNTLLIESADLNVVGSVIDAAIAAGATNISNIIYTVRDQTKVRSEALGNAARQARSKADALVAAMGMRIAGVRLIEESTSMYGGISIKGGRGAEAQVETPIQSGPIELRADVTITFDIAR